MIAKAVFVHIGAAFITRSQMVLLFNETRYFSSILHINDT